MKPVIADTKPLIAEGLWYRIGQDGLPPLAKNVFCGDKHVGRIIDVTEYDDTIDVQKSEPKYQAELIFHGWLDLGTYHDFNEALRRMESIYAMVETA